MINVVFHDAPFELGQPVDVRLLGGGIIPGIVRGYAVDYRGDLCIAVGCRLAGLARELLMQYTPSQVRLREPIYDSQ